jgi:N-methylhydantoinase A
VHAFSVARLLGIREVVFPRDAGVASAIGMLVAPRGVERVRTWRCLLDQLDWNRLEELLGDLERTGRDVIRQSRIAEDQISLEIAADIRYAGQGHELTVRLERERIFERDTDAIRQAFTDEYRRRYGLVLEHMPIEVVSWRVRTQGPAVSDQPRTSVSPRSASGNRSVQRRAFFRECGLVEVPVRARSGLLIDETVSGPALIEEETTTCVIGPGWSAALDGAGNLIMRSAA